MSLPPGSLASARKPPLVLRPSPLLLRRGAALYPRVCFSCLQSCPYLRMVQHCSISPSNLTLYPRASSSCSIEQLVRCPCSIATHTHTYTHTHTHTHTHTQPLPAPGSPGSVLLLGRLPAWGRVEK